MTTNTGSRAVIGFLKDYDERETWATKNYISSDQTWRRSFEQVGTDCLWELDRVPGS